MFGETYTLTFGDRGENHAGMQMIGSAASSGFSIDDLKAAEKHYKEKGRKTLFINLNLLAPDTKTEPAYLLIVRNAFGEKEATKIYKEQRNLEKDTKAFMRGRVVNKKARYNLCFDSKAQEPDYENKKGRIVAFDDVPKLKEVKKIWLWRLVKKQKL